MIASQSSSACQAAQARAFRGAIFKGSIDKHIVMASQQCRPRQHQLWHIVWLQGSCNAELAARGAALPLDGMLSHGLVI